MTGDVTTPGCYDGDEPELVFGVTRNDRVTHVWNDKGANRPYEVSLTLESFLPYCAEDIEPVHSRGPNGSCIVNRELAWANVRRRWVPYRGFNPAGYVLLAASGQNRAALERRAESLTDLPEGMTATVMRSDDVPGLRPGLHVLLYGGCEHRGHAPSALLPAPLALVG